MTFGGEPIIANMVNSKTQLHSKYLNLLVLTGNCSSHPPSRKHSKTESTTEHPNLSSCSVLESSPN